MTLNVKEALEHVKHALSSDRIPSIGGLRILNDAGEYLVAMHPWRWLEGEQATLGLLPNQPYIWLPEDTVSVSAMVANDTVHANITLTTAMELARRRSSTINTSFHYWAALVFSPRPTPTRIQCIFNGQPQNTYLNGLTISTSSTSYRFVGGQFSGFYSDDTWAFETQGTDHAANAQEMVDVINSVAEAPFYAELDPTVTGRFNVYAEFLGEPDSDYMSATEDLGGFEIQTTVPGRVGGPPMPRLDLWPTPAARKDDAFVAYYRRGWQRLRHDDQAVAIPVWIEPLYISIVRAVALGYERDAEGDVTARLEPIRTGMLFADLRRRDSLIQTDFGPIQNGAAEFDYGLNSQMWNFDQTGGPS